MASTYLTRTPSSAGNRKIFTFSAWVKRSNIGVNVIFQQGTASNYFKMNFQNDYLRWRGVTSGSNQAYLTTNRVFRDTSAWYHIVARFDSTNATAGDRMRLYINGVEETSFSTDINPSLNYESSINSTDPIDIGRDNTSNDSFFDGEMAHVHFIDGTAYAASAFGETDATTGIWKPKTNPSVTYGTNGFFLKFENSGSMGTDSSGNANNFTVNGTMTQNIDTPSNVFATWNPLQWTLDGPGNPPNTSFGNGNTSVLTSASSGDSSDVWGTLGASSGKYYHEVKMTNNPSDANNTSMSVGWGNAETGERITYYGSNGFKYTSSGSSAYGATFTQNDIIGCAVDLTNGTIEFYKNGVSQGQITGEITTNTGFWQPLSWDGSGSLTASWDANFGNGYFGTTQVSSAQNPDDGIGIFEYSVPTGYKALCTKSINAQEYS